MHKGGAQWQRQLERRGVVAALEEAEGGPEGLARRLLHQLSGLDLPRISRRPAAPLQAAPPHQEGAAGAEQVPTAALGVPGST